MSPLVDFIRNNKIISLAFGFLLFIGFISIVLFLIPKTKVDKTPSTPPSYISPPATSAPTTPTTKEKVYTYIKSMPGKTTKQQVLTYQNLKESKSLADGSIQYSFRSPVALRDDLVITKDDVVVFERVITRLQDSRLPKISTYQDKFGNPERTETGSSYYGEHEKTYIYTSYGFALVGNPFTDEIDEMHIFIPTTADKYLKQWGSDIQREAQGEKLR